MGNQGHSGNNYFQFKAWTEAGIIKDVTKIVAFMNSRAALARMEGRRLPVRRAAAARARLGRVARRAARASRTARACTRRPGAAGSPTAPARSATGARTSSTRRTGSCDLGLPHTIEAVRRDGPNDFIFPQASTIRFDFAARRGMPPVEVFWYDGVDNRPPLPAELGAGATLTEQNGKFIYSKTLVFKGGTHGDTLRIIPEDRMREMAASLPKIGGGFSDHATNFVLACQGKEESRSPFHVSGPADAGLPARRDRAAARRPADVRSRAARIRRPRRRQSAAGRPAAAPGLGGLLLEIRGSLRE